MKLERIFADLHIHIGRTESGQSVKISAARNLTFNRIVQEAYHRKGMQMIGIIDAHSPPVQEEIVQGLERGLYAEHSEGGLVYGETTVILGCELEVKEPGFGVAHLLTYFPTFEAIQTFTAWLSKYMKNVQLSTQRLHRPIAALEEKVAALGGILIPAHVFTPFKSIYGTATERMGQLLNLEQVAAVELGLSSDSAMADQLSELADKTFVSNSDAHSLPKIAREYNEFLLKTPSFLELKKVLLRQEGRRVIANYGLNPRLGKYYRTRCMNCEKQLEAISDCCPECGSKRVVRGVRDRLMRIADQPSTPPPHRPPYIHQVPLQFIPKLGPKTLDKLLKRFGTEMQILHVAKIEEIAAIAGETIAQYILLARQQRLVFAEGGGGEYGKVLHIPPKSV